MLIGYARVSTPDQKLDMQRDDLKRVGCRRLFTDVASGGKDRPGRAETIAYARKGDTIVVWKLDRFGRSLVDLVQTVAQLRERGVGFRSLHESIDTTTSGGRLIFHVFSALAEFERDLIRERTMAGLAAARARGRLGGRPALLDIEQRALLHTLAKDRNNSPTFICATLGISRTSFYRYLAKPAPAASTPKPTPATRPRKSTTASAHPRRQRPKPPVAKPSQRTRTNAATSPATRTTASSRSRRPRPKSSPRPGRKPLTRPAGNGAKNYAKAPR